MRQIALTFLLVSATSCESLAEIDDVNRTRVGLATRLERLDTDVTTASTGVLQATEEDTALQFDLSAGHRLHEHLELGGVLQIEHLESEVSAGGSLTSTEVRDIRIGPSARVYFVSKGAVQPWADVAAGIDYRRVESGGVSDSGIGFAIEGGLGLSAFVSRWVAFEGAIRVGGSTVELDDVDLEFDTTRIGFTLGISVFF